MAFENVAERLPVTVAGGLLGDAACLAYLATAVAERGSEAVRAAANLIAINLAAAAEDELLSQARSLADDPVDFRPSSSTSNVVARRDTICL